MNIERFLVQEDITVEEAIKKIDENGFGVVYVEADGKILGVISDGDIRRYVLKEESIKNHIQSVINRNYKFLYENSKESYKEFFARTKMLSVPIVDIERKLIKIVFAQGVVAEYHRNLEVPIVIMAGGKGTRLQPYTNVLPKPLIPVNDKTITEHILDRFINYDCNKFYMIVNYKKNLIKAYFQELSMNYDIEFIDEDQFMGTGGGLKLLSGKIQSTFILTNCDILVEADYKKILDQHWKNKNILTMVCAMKTAQIPYGTVDIDEAGNILRLVEKPTYHISTNAGFYVIEPEFLEEIPDRQFIHITDVIQRCLDQGKKIGTYLIDEKSWLDMGQFDELEHMKKTLDR